MNTSGLSNIKRQICKIIEDSTFGTGSNRWNLDKCNCAVLGIRTTVEGQIQLSADTILPWIYKLDITTPDKRKIHIQQPALTYTHLQTLTAPEEDWMSAYMAYIDPLDGWMYILVPIGDVPEGYWTVEWSTHGFNAPSEIETSFFLQGVLLEHVLLDIDELWTDYISGDRFDVKEDPDVFATDLVSIENQCEIEIGGTTYAGADFVHLIRLSEHIFGDTPLGYGWRLYTGGKKLSLLHCTTKALAWCKLRKPVKNVPPMYQVSDNDIIKFGGDINDNA